MRLSYSNFVVVFPWNAVTTAVAFEVLCVQIIIFDASVLQCIAQKG